MKMSESPLYQICHNTPDLWEEQFIAALEGTVHQRPVTGHGKGEDVLALMPGVMIYKDNNPTYAQRIYVAGASLFVRVTINESGFIEVKISGLQPHVDALAVKVAAVLVQDPPTGSVYVLVQTQCGYALHSCGKINAELERGNYAKETLQDIDHITSCLSSQDPCGRLVVMDGPPGTGKSYAIRALTCQVKATFVLVAPSLVGSLSGPQVAPVLLEKRGDGPIVLIMEDADAALINRRTGGDLGQLSEILNLGDGLLGELMDVRILATTNAGRVDLDEAVMRPGRLCRHVEFASLEHQQAEKVYTRLLRRGDVAQAGIVHHTTTTLAEVYRLARRDGWKPEVRREGGHYL